MKLHLGMQPKIYSRMGRQLIEYSDDVGLSRMPLVGPEQVKSLLGGMLIRSFSMPMRPLRKHQKCTAIDFPPREGL